MIVLIFFTAIVFNFSIDNYLPSLPFIAKSLNANLSTIQLAFACTSVGMGIGSFLSGIILTKTKRQPVYCIACLLGIVGEAVCMFPVYYEIFILGRIIVGISIGALLSVVVTLLCDLYNGRELAKINSYLMLTLALVPAISPYLGGYIQEYLGWRFNFLFPLIFYVFILAFIKISIKTTYTPSSQNKQVGIGLILVKYFSPLKEIKVVLTTLCGILTLGSMFVYWTIGPKIFEIDLKLTPVQFGSMAVFPAFAFLLSSFLNTKTIKYGFKLSLLTGNIIALIGVLMLFALYCMNYFNVIAIVLPITVFLFGINFIHINCLPLVTTFFEKKEGNPGALFIFLQTTLSSGLGVLAAYIPTGNQLFLGLVLLIIVILIFFIMFFLFVSKTKEGKRKCGYI